MKIVCIGGGHGLSQVLDALKTMPCELTAIVTTTDNGGSTGRLRKDPTQIAFGDIRRCAETLGDRENLLTLLSEQRFDLDNDLNGHSFGNILLSALNQITHNSSDAIKIFCAMLGVKQRILPMANGPVDLVATTEHGERIVGECHVDALTTFPKHLSLSNAVIANQQAVDAILAADLVLLGPGSLLTSIIPPLLLNGIRDALLQTAGCRIFIENLVPEHSVVDSIPANEHVEKAMAILGYKFFDVCLTPDAFEAMDLRAITKEKQTTTHNKSQLKHIIEQLLPRCGDVERHSSTKVH